MKRYIILIASIISSISMLKAKNDYPCPSLLHNFDKCAVYAIYQDRTEAVWINSEMGTFRYDSYELRPIDILSDCRSSCFNGDALIYFTGEEGVFCLNTLTEEKKTIRTAPQSNPRKYVIFAQGDELIAGSGQSLMAVESDSLITICSIPISSGRIRAITASPTQGIFLAGTSKGHLIEFDLKGETRTVGVYDDDICTIFTASDDTIYIGFENIGYIQLSESYRMLSNSGKSAARPAPRKVRTFVETSQGAILAGSIEGLYHLDVNGNFRCETTYMPHGHAASSLMADSNDNIWVGTFYSGIILFPHNGYPYRNISLPKQHNIQLIDGLTEDSDGNIWIATDRHGLHCYSPSDNTYRNITAAGNRKFKSIFHDAERKALWLGEYTGDLHMLDIRTGSIRHYQAKDRKGKRFELSTYAIIKFGEDLYLGTSRGIYMFNPEKETSITRKVPNLETSVYSFATGQQGTLYMASKGIFRLYKGSLEKMPFPDNIMYSDVICDNHGDIWAAGLTKGVYRLSGDGLTKFSKETCGIESDLVSKICQADENIFILGRESGISIFDPSDNTCFNYSSNSGLNLGSSKEGQIIISRNGLIYMGGTEGIISISPDDIKNISDRHEVHIDMVTINGKRHTAARFASMKDKLKHTENNISFYITDNNYSGVNTTYCRYLLEGYSQEWTDTRPGSSITFSSLRPGKYRLLLQYAAYQQDINYREYHVGFRIYPPWYASPVAIIIYILITVLSILACMYIINKNMIKDEKRRIRETENEDRIKFFTNISHELRTPLTLIIGQLELLASDTGLNHKATQNILSALDKARKTSGLVSDLLLFEKLNQRHGHLYVCKVDINSYIQSVVDSFALYAEYRKISLSFRHPKEEVRIMMDAEQMQKVFSNLLINSFRFTPKLGCIAVELKLSGPDTVIITIEDTGCGISEDALSRIFSPYYQDPLSENSKRSQGTGIGLALSKSIIEMHHGSISATNSRTGGAIFTISLPLQDEWAESDDGVTITNDKPATPPEVYMPPQIMEQTPKDDGKEKVKMLIVEDDADMRSMLTMIFGHSYTILEAGDGQEGLSIARNGNPDIIICDVMMPVMDGFSFCTEIKNDFTTCHIPVILLTAYDSEHNNIQSIRSGADDYISKPFSIDILKSRCQNLLENKERMKKKFTVNSAGIEHLTKDSRDKDFLLQLTRCIEGNISDYNLNVNTLCESAMMSRTMLTEKLKGLTGYTPREFIEVIRFRKAAALLKETDMTISEISYEVGFNSQKYFSSRFKKQFGKTPSEWAER